MHFVPAQVCWNRYSDFENIDIRAYQLITLSRFMTDIVSRYRIGHLKSIMWFWYVFVSKSVSKFVGANQCGDITKLDYQSSILLILHCLDAIDLKLSQLIWPAARGRCNDKAVSPVHTIFIQGCQGSFTCLSIEHWVQGTI